MAKKEKSKLGNLDLSDDLDFGDFNFDEVDSKVDKSAAKNKRKPVASAFKGVVGGAKSATMSKSMMSKFLRSALPKEYGETLDRTGDVTSEVSSLYNQAVKEIKPNLQKIASEVDKLVPNEMKRSKGYLGKLRNLLGEEETNTGSRGEDRDAMIQSKLAEVFSVQAEQQEKQHAQERAENHLKGKVQANQFKASFGLLNSINVNLTKLSNYNERVNSAYQKKSLELQYRSYFVQQELLDTSKKFFEIFKAQNEAITKNTGLPDYAKLQGWERFKDVTQRKMFGNAGKLFSNSEFIKKGIGNLKKAARDKISRIGGAFGDAAMGLESANSMREMMDSMGGLGGEAPDKYGMAGEFAGGMAAEQFAKWLGGKLGDKVPKKVRDHILKAAKKTGNLQGTFAELRKSKHLQWSMDDEMSGKLGQAKNKGRDILSSLMDIFGTGGIDTQLATSGGIGGLSQNAIFDRQAHKSITSVIPGYLARIFRELQVIRSGNNNVQLMDYDFKSDRFLNKGSMKASIEKDLGKAAKSMFSGYKQDEAYGLITGDRKLSKSAEKALRDKLADVSFTAEGLDGKSLRSSDFTKGLSASDALEIQTAIAENFNPLSSDYANKDYKLSSAITESRDSINDVRDNIQALYNAGYGEQLKQMGIITVKGSTVNINMETYKKLVKDGSLGKTFSKQMKRQSSAPGKMQTAPKPTAPTQSIAQRVLQFKPTRTINQQPISASGGMGDASLPVLTGIKSDTAAIIERLDALGKLGYGVQRLDMSEVKKYFADLKKNASDKMHGFGDFVSQGQQTLSSKIGGLATGNSKTVMGNIQNLAASAGSLLVGTLSSISSGLFGGVKKANEKVIQPAKQKAGQLYTNNKDQVIDFSKSIFTKGLELVGTVFDKARTGLTDLISNKLPAGYKQIAAGMKWLKSKAKNLLDSPTDIYVAGNKVPALRAVLMRAGAYLDQKTGKPIFNPGDIQGTVVNTDGEVVLTMEDIRKGIFDKEGQPITSLTKKLMNAGIGLASTAYDKIKGALSKWAELGSGIGGKMSGWMQKHFSGLGGEHQVSLLTQIRDLLNTRLPGRQTKFKDKQIKSAKSASKSDTTKVIDQTKAKAQQVVDKVKEKSQEAGGYFSGLFDKAKTFAKDKADQFKARQTQSEETKKNRYVAHADTGPRYKSKRNVIDTMIGAGTSALSGDDQEPSKLHGWFNRAKGYVKDKAGKFKGLGGFMTPGIIDYKTAEKEKAAEKAKAEAERVKHREGNADDLLKARRAQSEETKKNRYVAQASTDPRYKSSKNVLDVIAEKAASAYDTIKDGLGTIADIAGMKGGKGGLLRRGAGALARGAGGLIKGTSAIGRGIMGAASMLPGASKVGTVLRVGRTAMMAASLLTPGIGGAVMGGIGLIGSALASPFVLGAGAAALAGYGIYKGYKFLTRNKVSKMTLVRMLQYGLSDKHSSFYHQVLELETYLESTSLSMASGQPQLNERKLDIKQILSIFNVDQEDTEALQNFTTWLSQRFKPVFLTHESAIYSLDPKKKLSEIDDLKPEQKDQYLKAIASVNDVASVTASPFQDKEPLSVSSKDITAAIDAARNEFKDDLPENKKPPNMFAKATNFLFKSETLDKMAAQGGIKGALAKIASYVPGLALGLNVFEKGVKLGTSLFKKIRPFFSGPPTALESVRFKTYGLKFMQPTKISALRDLEAYLNDFVKVTGNQASFTGNIAEVVKEVGSSFGISSLEDENAKNWVNWFNNRFLPTFISFIGSSFSLIGSAEAAEIEPKLTNNQKYDLALRLSGTDVWGVKDTPWNDGVEVCGKNDDCADNLAFLKDKVKQDALKEQAIKEGNKTPNKQKIDQPKPPPAIDIPKTDESVSSMSEGEKASVDLPSSPSGTVKSGPVPMAGGSLADPTQGDQFISLGKNVSLNGVNPELLRNLKMMAAEYGQATGKSINITSGFRTQDQQEALYRRDPSKAAKPGFSLHERGLALDISSADLNALEELGLMRKYGFTRPVGGEPWHMEPAGIQANIGLAKSDPTSSAKMIMASVGKGGGGYGTVSGAMMGKRDSNLALSLLGSDAPVKTVALSDKDKIAATLTPPAFPKMGSNASTASSGSVSGSTATASPGAGTIVASAAANDSYGMVQSGTEGEKPQLGKSFGYNKSTSTGGDVKSTINDAAKSAGVDPSMMQTFAAIESGMNPNAKAGTSSASGLYQFTGSTWRYMLSKYGSKYGIDPSTPPTDAKANSLMAAEYMKENAKSISRSRPNPSSADLYAAHFLGATGANKLFNADPNAIAADLLPRAAAGNKPIFYNKDGSPRTVAQLQEHLNNKVQTTAQRHGNTPGGTSPLTTPPTMVAQNTQGRPVIGMQPSANDDSYTAPPRTSAPSTFVPPEILPVEPPARPAPNVMLAGLPPVTPGSRSPTPQRVQGQGLGANSGDQTLTNIDSTLSQSLNVQTQMLTALQQLVSTMNPSQMQDTLKMITSKLGDMGGQSKSGSGLEAPTPGVSLARKAA